MIVVGTHTIFIYKYSRSQLVNFINWFWLCFKKRKKPAFCKLLGVGAKVADYVCLMSLDKHDAVPVDTRVADNCKTLHAPTYKDQVSYY